jgi:hypothetical protein
MKKPFGIAAVFCMAATVAQADMTVSLKAPRDGKTVPDGQHCRLFGGDGSTPPMHIAGIPEGTVLLRIEFNDLSYDPLSYDGGHGVVGVDVTGAEIELSALPGMTADLPEGTRIISKSRSSGKYASDGYLPPCSGGRGNLYSASVKAMSADGKMLGKTKLSIGKY